MRAKFTKPLGENDEGRRLDKILRIVLNDMPLSAIHRALRKGDIRVNGERRGPEYRCRAGDVLQWGQAIETSRAAGNRPPALSGPPNRRSSERAPTLLPLLETADLLFVDKPLGSLSHGRNDSLEAAVRQYLSTKLPPSLAFRPGPLHRLDRNTSGLMAFSRSMEGARVFSEALKSGLILKTYIALVEGRVEAETVWRDIIVRDASKRKTLIGKEAAESLPAVDDCGPAAAGSDSARPQKARPALTALAPLFASDSFSLVALSPQTGRTHQLRAQAAYHGHPLAGDVKYGGRRCEKPYYLHAWKLSFRRLLFPDLPEEISAPLPYYFMEKLAAVFSATKKEVYFKLSQFPSEPFEEI